MDEIERIMRQDWARLVNAVQRYPHRTNKQLAAQSRTSRFGPRPAVDVEAARIYLGRPFPEQAGHDWRSRAFYALGWLSGLVAHPEHRAGSGRCDVLICTPADEPLAVIEVKSGSAGPNALSQVRRYRAALNAPVAIVTAPQFTPSARAAVKDELLLTGQQTADFIGLLATRQVFLAILQSPVEAA